MMSHSIVGGYCGALCLQISFQEEREIGLGRWSPTKPAQTSADLLLVQAKPTANPTITHALGLEAKDDLVPLVGFLVCGRAA
jgi:hypothetical protein